MNAGDFSVGMLVLVLLDGGSDSFLDVIPECHDEVDADI